MSEVIFILIFIIIIMDIETKRMLILSKNKKAVMVSLQNGPKLMQELVIETGTRAQNLSRTIQELRTLDIVTQKNPGARKGKIFELSEKGKKCFTELKEGSLL